MNRVRPAVVVSAELHDGRPPGAAAGDPDGRLNGLRARVAEDTHLSARNDAADELRQLSLELMTCAITKALRHLVGDGVDHRLWLMTEEIGPEAEDVIDVLVAVDVDEMGAAAAVEADRHRLLQGSKGGRHAAGEASRGP